MNRERKKKCAANAIQVFLFVINHTILLPLKWLSVNVTEISGPFKMLQISWKFPLKTRLTQLASQLLVWRGLLKIDCSLSTQMYLLRVKEKCHLQTFFLYSHARTKFSLMATEVLGPVFDWCAVAWVVFGWEADLQRGLTVFTPNILLREELISIDASLSTARRAPHHSLSPLSKSGDYSWMLTLQHGNGL